MLHIFVLVVAGIAIGWLAEGKERLKKLFVAAGKVQQAGTLVLLFAMGLWLGGNQEFWSNIGTLGLNGFLFAAATVTGSALCVYLLVRLLFRREGKA